MRAVVINDMFCRGSILCCALLLCCLCLWPAGARALSSDAARACVVEAESCAALLRALFSVYMDRWGLRDTLTVD